MKLDKTILQRLAVRADVTDYVRIIARAHAGTPLGMGFGKSRFSSPKDKFQLLYLAQDPMTAVAETIVRDRFQGKAERVIFQEEFDRYSIAAVRNPGPLFLLDLRYEGANLLGVSTDAVRARAQASGRRLSQDIYDRTDFDGILYMSRITNKQCVAVYDRATAGLEADSPALDLPRLSALGLILDALQVTVISRE
ncbi:RES family NAD+ phosphorylase [Rhizobium lentis]|uniref:RES family NAD+ phosphorylase n=2 Tax=Rhizobium lentis TaxID=1138194 RepID=A0ABS7I8D4_9HYPH|nr:RES family NAD+ phosphorylase [Rhizobium lentis]MBX4958156.1 RES family NAD+ phosphorylase [Rhizobium lentis]MBX4976327.1 RES family NAD+ phosphorylase [Rhizobium lentis]MBX4988160.1 RES family NAD+ phosphorylase [Rhizobium lentis]MBX5006609.1 RES family NAD+ phosphorylase [Rhizobium lentis]MBX5037299.1 RES family NAD+ phosphorylase [Rhizobium lentis]